MIVLAVCTEGENSEPNYIEALKSVLFGTTPGGNTAVEVVTVPLNGNHGFKKIFKKAEAELELKTQDSRNILSVLGEDDEMEKWLIIDYDKMHKYGVSEEWLRGEAVKNEYALAINRPNFEFFVLAHFMPVTEAARVATKNLKDAINDKISDYNSRRGFDKDEFSALRLPKYSKGSFQSKDLFWKLLDQNIDLLDVFDEGRCYCDSEHYTEMWKIIERIKGLVGERNSVG